MSDDVPPKIIEAFDGDSVSRKTMTVWVLLKRYDYEGDLLVGVFSTEDAARKAADGIDRRFVEPVIAEVALDQPDSIREL
tara:strand:- start:243 stop:482 length:240 start_codon:yes stop_codon:yes gene_type:complete